MVTGLGVLLLASGLWLVGGYVARAVAVLHEPDRSWLFWGLAILFLGLMLAGAGAGLIAWGRSLARRPAERSGP